LRQHVSVYINCHQRATACGLPKLQYTSRWLVDLYIAINIVTLAKRRL